MPDSNIHRWRRTDQREKMLWHGREANKTGYRNTNGQAKVVRRFTICGMVQQHHNHNPLPYIAQYRPTALSQPGSIGSVRFGFSAAERDFRRRQPVIKKTRPANERRLLDGHPP